MDFRSLIGAALCTIFVTAIPARADSSLTDTLGSLTHSLSQYNKLGLSAQQKRDIFALTTAHDVQKSKLKEQIEALHQKTGRMFLQPEPDTEAIFAAQKEIDALEAQVGADEVKTVVAIRRLLTPEQRLNLVYGDPEKALSGAGLSPGQRQAFRQVMKDYVGWLLVKERELDRLEFDQTLLYQDAVLDEAALLAKQGEINKLKNEMADERVRLAVKTRGVLSREQMLTAFNRHHPKVWTDTGINKKQDDTIMGIHMKIEASDQRGRRKLSDLENELASIYAVPEPDEKLAYAKQEEIDHELAIIAREQLDLIIEARKQLTPKQKQKLSELMRGTVGQDQLGAEPPSVTVPVLGDRPADAVEQAKKRITLSERRGIHYLHIGDTLVQHLGSARLTTARDGTVNLHSGEILVRPASNIVVKAGPAKVSLIPGSIGLVSLKDDCLAARNLYASGTQLVTVDVPGKQVELNAGEELIVGDNESAIADMLKAEPFGRRKVIRTKLPEGGQACHSEVSLISLLQLDPVLKRVCRDGNERDRELKGKIVKFAAALMHATGSHGQYSLVVK